MSIRSLSFQMEVNTHGDLFVAKQDKPHDTISDQLTHTEHIYTLQLYMLVNSMRGKLILL
jgi:hypothetical protein